MDQKITPRQSDQEKETYLGLLHSTMRYNVNMRAKHLRFLVRRL